MQNNGILPRNLNENARREYFNRALELIYNETGNRATVEDIHFAVRDTINHMQTAIAKELSENNSGFADYIQTHFMNLENQDEPPRYLANQTVGFHQKAINIGYWLFTRLPGNYLIFEMTQIDRDNLNPVYSGLLSVDNSIFEWNVEEIFLLLIAPSPTEFENREYFSYRGQDFKGFRDDFTAFFQLNETATAMFDLGFLDGEVRVGSVRIFS